MSNKDSDQKTTECNSPIFLTGTAIAVTGLAILGLIRMLPWIVIGSGSALAAYGLYKDSIKEKLKCNSGQQ